MPNVLLSVVTWNSADSIEACLRSALAQTYTDFELWVVDNASADDTRARVQALAATDARLRLHALPTNTGFCGGHNYALDRTATELVLLVNPDVEMAPDYLARAVAAMHQHPRIGTVCGLLLQTTEPDPRIDSAGMLRRTGGRFGLRLHGQRLSEAGPLARTDVAGADGALPLLRRLCIDDLRVEGAFFDPRFFAHKEDWDVAWRSQLYGWRTVFEPACRALHPRQFLPASLAVRRRLGGALKADAVKNQWLLLVKNTPARQVPAMLVQALPRQVFIIFYLMLFERTSLKALSYVWQHRHGLLASRRLVQARATRPPTAAFEDSPHLPAPRAAAPAPAALPRTGWRPALAPPPLLSICVPTYHRPGLLARALRSLGPLPPEVEVLVSDNSTANDLGGRVARLGLRRQPAGQWRYYRNAPGSTAADNFAACIRRARGHYLYHLHDDDFLRPGGLARLVAELRTSRGQHEVLLFGVDVVDARKRVLRRQYPSHRRWLAPVQALTRVLTDSSWVRIPALVASRAAYLATPPDPAQEDTDDTDLWARFFGQWGVLLVPGCIAAYTVHEGALTTSMFNEHTVELLLRIFTKAQAQGLLPAPRLRQAQAQFFNQFVLAGAYRSLRRHDAATARRVLKLLKLPALQGLPVALRWLPIKLVFNAITWVAALALATEAATLAESL
ncbi:glycosyltransferase family 2 protein [Hymenobacter sp. H14-R3]|uniref:glycosyltransferase family 2 protein n=1 Tax=Hymenobacter sp. H14-R3 TaxID=3046308 RepID=UPI0024B9936A|nr:glycosyltransferase family 2 protein [Hymenobacter sp. H14-R3]MDJ0367180.1 glycosyltransferase family 2 protein [Hymenobacter sp. H14-R3]